MARACTFDALLTLCVQSNLLQFPVRLRNEAASGELFRKCTHPLNVFAVVLYAAQLSDPYTFAKVLDNYMEAFMNLKVPVG